ncbi:hypothetical protein LXL04_037299 [Taraxacum kok-saghyz]
MSVVDKESIEVIAQSIGVGNLSPDVLPSLAADIEYRVREIMQEAIKCMRHAKRTAMTSEDVDTALDLRKMEPIYVASGDSLRFKRAAMHKDLFYLEDKDVEFREVIDTPLPKASLDTALVNHWLAIEGVQPAIPENFPLEALVTPIDNKNKEDGAVSAENKTPVKHVLSIELQLYFEKITDLTVTRSNSSVIFNKALHSLATDAGIHPLLPYFIYFVAEEVTRNLNNFQLLFALMRLVRSLVQNPFLHMEPYLIQLMPSVMTCLIAKTLGNNKPTDNHWELRNFTASLVGLICRKFGHGYHNLQLRVTRTLVHSLLDPSKGLPQHYGAVKGMTAMGSSVVRLLLLPNLDLYLQFLEPEMHRNNDAWRVHGALLCAAGLCVYNQLKMIPNLLSPPNPNKRKAIMMDPVKKVGEGLVKVEMQSGSGFSITRADRFLSNESMSVPIGGRRERFGGGLVQMSSVAVSRAWKKEINAGHLIPKLYHLFGESLLPFVPSPELCNIFL